jgi:hypothetical protein
MWLLTWWLVLTGIGLAGLLIWTFVPILVPVLMVLAGLSVITTTIVAMARRLERYRKPSAANDAGALASASRRAPRRSELPD